MTSLILFTYQHKDHTSAKLSTGLGNNRLSYADANGNGRIDTPASTAITVWEETFEDKSKANNDWDGSGNSWGWPITDIVSDKAHSGSKSGMLQNTTPSSREIVTHSNEWILINNSKPTLYKYSGWVYVDGYRNGAQIYFFMKTAGENNYYTSFDYISVRERNKWAYVEKTVLVPPEISRLNIRIDNDSGWYELNSDAKVWFDDLKIEQLDMSQNEIVSETNYYPFGLAHKGYNEHSKSSNLGENYKYNQGTNGKTYQGGLDKSFRVERQLEMSLNVDMTKFRMYDYALGRFTSVDPLADANPQESWNPYQYAYNNPIRYNDPYGDCPKCWDFIKNVWNSTSINSVSVSLGAGVKLSNTGATASIAEFDYNLKTSTFSFNAIEAFAGVGDSQDAVKGEIKVAYSAKNLDNKKGEGGFIKIGGVKIKDGDKEGGSVAIFAKNKDGKKGAALTENINDKNDGITEVSPPEAANKLKFGVGISFSFDIDKFNNLQEESVKEHKLDKVHK